MVSSTIRNSIGQYILQDVDTTIDYKWRLNYKEEAPDKWGNYSRFRVKVALPRVDQYFNVSPKVELLYLINHSNSTLNGENDPWAFSQKGVYSRIGSAYVDVKFSEWVLSYGYRRLSFQGGRFISDSGFNAIPRTFGQVSVHSQQGQFGLFYLFNYLDTNRLDNTSFKKGSYILSLDDIPVGDGGSIGVYAYLLEDVSDTYSLAGKYQMDKFQSIESTVAYQQPPSIKTVSSQKPSSYYVDSIYRIKSNTEKISLGFRFFKARGGGGFSAPFSSGHSWDGYLNSYQSNIKTGQHMNGNSYQTLFGSFSTKTDQFESIGAQAILFRSGNEFRNLGSEINVWITNTWLPNHVFWTYKLAQFIRGDNTPPSELAMWFDFELLLGER